jgi:Short C-terminal domain
MIWSGMAREGKYTEWLGLDVRTGRVRARNALIAIGCEGVVFTGEGHVSGRLPRSGLGGRGGGDVLITLTEEPREVGDDPLTKCEIRFELMGSLERQRKLYGLIRAQLDDVRDAGLAVDPTLPMHSNTPNPHLAAIPSRVRKHATTQISRDEPILFHLVGLGAQTLIALNDRVIILKPGFMANTSFGCRTTTIRYRDITGVEVSTGLVTGVLQVTSPSYPAARVDFWTQANKVRKADANSPYVVPNCIPVSKSMIKAWAPRLERLRALIDESHHTAVAQPTGPPVAPPPPGATVATAGDRLREVAALREAGLITTEEFEAKKTEILRDL